LRKARNLAASRETRCGVHRSSWQRAVERTGDVVIGRIFVNFRVGDVAGTAALIDQKLCRVFGEDLVFRSSRSIPAGRRFPSALVEEAAACLAMVVVIGPNWLARDENGNRRIDARADWVRTEIEFALTEGKPVIPVLVDGRPRLAATDNLPASITDLVDLQFVRIDHRAVDYQLMQIVDQVRPYVPMTESAMPRPANSIPLTGLRSTQRSSDVQIGQAEINGFSYRDSVIYRSTVFANSPRGSISFNLGRQYRRLEVTAGVLDDAVEAHQQGVFQVVADDEVRAEVVARHGVPRRLDVDVTDVLHLQLVAYRPGTTRHPAMAGVNAAFGVSNKLPELAWGNPVLHP
jgi:hypothetical protein